MLSRIAESLFWIGRYVERADDTARLLQTHLRLLVEDTQPAEVDACRNLLALMSVEEVENPTHPDLLRVLGTTGPSRPRSTRAGRPPGTMPGAPARSSPSICGNASTRTWQQLPATPFGRHHRPHGS